MLTWSPGVSTFIWDPGICTLTWNQRVRTLIWDPGISTLAWNHGVEHAYWNPRPEETFGGRSKYPSRVEMKKNIKRKCIHESLLTDSKSQQNIKANG